MPTFFGLSAMPTTLLNSALGLLPDRSLPVRGRDSIAVVCPVYNEARGVGGALASLFAQTRPPDEIALSINGCTDDTHGVATATLREHGFTLSTAGPAEGLPAELERWHRPAGDVTVFLLVYQRRTAKSEAINNLAGSSILRSQRLLLVDGDTVLEPGFLAAVCDHFYRLRWVGRRPVLEDYALQSGSVTSYVPPGATATQRFIAAGRAAEYAFSGLLRSGQVRTLGGGPLWGSSRLFTVIGCGFVARRDVLPMPCDTLTEDHDLTLAAQARPARLERLSPRELGERGLEIVVNGESMPFEAMFDRQDVIEVRRGGNARFVTEARMATEDPAHLGGYVRQIERWDGGGLQNALKRVLGEPRERRMGANARFALLSSQAENILGLCLLFVLPVVLALGTTGAPGGRRLADAVGWWFGIDFLANGIMTLLGFYLHFRGTRAPPVRALARAALRTLRCWPPYALLKTTNPVAFLAAASRVVPAYVRARRALRRHVADASRGVVWERPTTRTLEPRTLGAAGGLLTSLAAVFAVVALLVPGMSADQKATARLLFYTPHVDMAAHAGLPLDGYGLSADAAGAASDVAPAIPLLAPPALARRVVPAPVPAAPVVAAPAPVTPLSAATEPVPASAVPHAAAPAAPVAAAREAPSPVPASVSAQSVPASAQPSAQPSVPRSSSVAVDDPAAASPAASVSAFPPVMAAPSLSRYCDAADLRRPSDTWRTLPGTAADYHPLTRFELLMLGRLAPIEPYLEEAATAYDVPAGFLLQVLINESYLDPLAVGATGDKGLSQMTPDALTLLRGISQNPGSAFYNPQLLAGGYQVYDPDFSICAGAAKLAWARSRPAATDEVHAYALYINPLNGVSRAGAVAPDLLQAVGAMERLAPLVQALGNAYAAFRQDPGSVTGHERDLLGVSASVAAGDIGLDEAYRSSSGVEAAAGIDDAAVYDGVLRRLFPAERAEVPPDAQANAH